MTIQSAVLRLLVWSLLAGALSIGCSDPKRERPSPPSPPPVRDLSEATPPTALEEALITLEEKMPAELYLEFAQSSDEGVAVQHHHDLGLWIRNNWGLWQKGPLFRDLERRGLWHPDDMSGLILTSFWRRLHEQPLEIEEQVRKYELYWEHVQKRNQEGAPRQ